jgi:Uma2 family endonuclease
MVATQPRPYAAPAPDELLMTAEEFFTLPDDHPRELVNGKVIDFMPPGFQHGTLAGDIYAALRTFARQHDLGRAAVESGFVLRRKPDMVRSPDVSVLEESRLPEGRLPRGFIEGPPTLAVEIVSPHDLWSEVEDKVQEYLDAGAKAVWVFDPATQTVHVRTEKSNAVYTRADTLPGGDALPGFELKLTELFEEE